MKKSIRLAAVLTIWMSLAVTHAHSGDFVGTFCFYTKIGETNFEVYRLAFTHIDSGIFNLNGTHRNPSTTGTGAVQGTAVSQGSALNINLHESHTDAFGVSTTTCNAMIDIGSLKGTAQCIAQDYSQEFEPLSYNNTNVFMGICK